MRTLALCAGYGGLELGLAMAGFEPELVAYAEVDQYASKVMAERFPEAPNLGDLTKIEQPPAVDAVVAGFPCQPVSAAGKGKGTEDERWLIRDVVRIWKQSGAHWLFLENVLGLYHAQQGRAFEEVIDALAEVGATARWSRLTASSIGACHKRERWFCVAADPDSEHAHWGGTAGPDGRHEPSDGGVASAVKLLPTPTSGDAKASGARAYPATSTRHTGTTLTDATTRGLVDWGEYGAAIERHELLFGREAPEPKVGGRLSPRFVEWMMGLPDGWVTSVADVSRTQQLKILGNGVMPQQAAVAYHSLVTQSGVIE